MFRFAEYSRYRENEIPAFAGMEILLISRIFFYNPKMPANEIHYQFGIAESHRADAARLYEEAFGKKFAVAVANDKERLALTEESLSLSFAAAAFSGDELVGIAGFKTSRGSFMENLTFKAMFRRLGFWRGLRALTIFSLYERPRKKSEFMLDGIAVKETMRGRGVGSAMIAMIKERAREDGYLRLRLDVVDTNPAARRLYERLGFVAGRPQKFEEMRWLFRFGKSTPMFYNLEKEKQ